MAYGSRCAQWRGGEGRAGEQGAGVRRTGASLFYAGSRARCRAWGKSNAASVVIFALRPMQKGTQGMQPVARNRGQHHRIEGISRGMTFVETRRAGAQILRQDGCVPSFFFFPSALRGANPEGCAERYMKPGRGIGGRIDGRGQRAGQMLRQNGRVPPALFFASRPSLGGANAEGCAVNAAGRGIESIIKGIVEDRIADTASHEGAARARGSADPWVGRATPRRGRRS
ncbi:hypothetical protein B0H17DRAFT_1045262 [Mycena rosella]|uniref:Uncharacterized protein n=1 Tax=Mycena rosella TaxID=1033263 RepID=A0AAD7DXL9_MYCRO|nr:hypothetical protein B0H17DRAFT_1045262 [Mycena rosella]